VTQEDYWYWTDLADDDGCRQLERLGVIPLPAWLPPTMPDVLDPETWTQMSPRLS